MPAAHSQASDEYVSEERVTKLSKEYDLFKTMASKYLKANNVRK